MVVVAMASFAPLAVSVVVVLRHLRLLSGIRR
jgi:hypothetical protein